MPKNDITCLRIDLAEQLQNQPIDQALNASKQALTNRIAPAIFQKVGSL